MKGKSSSLILLPTRLRIIKQIRLLNRIILINLIIIKSDSIIKSDLINRKGEDYCSGGKNKASTETKYLDPNYIIYVCKTSNCIFKLKKKKK